MSFISPLKSALLERLGPRTSCLSPTPPELEELGQLRQTLFMGNTLRGLLLTFDTMGGLAGYAAIGCFIGAAALAVLALLGFRLAKRAEQAEPHRSTQPIGAR